MKIYKTDELYKSINLVCVIEIVRNNLLLEFNQILKSNMVVDIFY